MDKIKTLIAFVNKQQLVINTLHTATTQLDLNDYNQRYVFALKTQQLFTAVEDAFKAIAVTFENNIDSPQSYHIELLKRMRLEISEIRPAVITDDSFKILDKLRAFRHFIRHAYDYELDKDELLLLQQKQKNQFQNVITDIDSFVKFLNRLIQT